MAPFKEGFVKSFSFEGLHFASRQPLAVVPLLAQCQPLRSTRVFLKMAAVEFEKVRIGDFAAMRLRNGLSIEQVFRKRGQRPAFGRPRAKSLDGQGDPSLPAVVWSPQPGRHRQGAARGQKFVASHVTGVPMDQSLSATFLPTCSRHKPRRLIRYSTRSGDVPKCFAITADDVPFVTAD